MDDFELRWSAGDCAPENKPGGQAGALASFASVELGSQMDAVLLYSRVSLFVNVIAELQRAGSVTEQTVDRVDQQDSLSIGSVSLLCFPIKVVPQQKHRIGK